MSSNGARVPPQSLEAEMAVLGAMLLEREACITAMEILRPDDFYREAHRLIYLAALDLTLRAEPADLVTVAAELERRGQLDQVGGRHALPPLLDAVPTSLHCAYYAQIVRGKAVLRRMIAAGSDMADECYGEIDDVEGLAAKWLAEVRSVADDAATGHALVTQKEAVEERFAYYAAVDEAPHEITGLRTGMQLLDLRMDGLQPSETTVIAARKGGGKTVMAQQIAIHAARSGVTVQYHTLEMTVAALTNRAVAALGRLDSLDLRRGRLTPDERERRQKALGTLYELPIIYDPTPAVAPGHVLATARRQKPGLIVIDHVGLMRPDRSHRDNKVVEEAETSNAIKAIANELGVPVLALMQLRKGGNGASPQEPLDELKGSGAWSEDAGCVIRLVEPKDQDELAGWQSQPKPVLIHAHIDKNRHADTGTVPLLWFREWSRFECQQGPLAGAGQDWTR